MAAERSLSVRHRPKNTLRPRLTSLNVRSDEGRQIAEDDLRHPPFRSMFALVANDPAENASYAQVASIVFRHRCEWNPRLFVFGGGTSRDIHEERTEIPFSNGGDMAFPCLEHVKRGDSCRRLNRRGHWRECTMRLMGVEPTVLTTGDAEGALHTPEGARTPGGAAAPPLSPARRAHSRECARRRRFAPVSSGGMPRLVPGDGHTAIPAVQGSERVLNPTPRRPLSPPPAPRSLSQPPEPTDLHTSSRIGDPDDH